MPDRLPPDIVAAEGKTSRNMSFRPPITSSLSLLPLDDGAWEWKAFERFCLDLVNALADVDHAELYGAQGDKQDGIDILAYLINGGQRTYQCKKYKAFAKARAEKAISENTFVGAVEHVLLVACNTSLATQTYVNSQPGWRLLDREGISSLVRTGLDREAARRIVDDHLGPGIRQAFLGFGPMTFVEPAIFFAPSVGRRGLFRHDWELAGRVQVLGELNAALDGSRVVVLPGRGGVGKTRLLKELVDRRGERMLFALDDVPITAQAADDLPMARITVVVDDIHRRDDLGPLFAEAVRRPDITILVAGRPQHLDVLRAGLMGAGYTSTEVHFADQLGDLPVVDTEALARQALGPEHAQHAARLAKATADCPLVTVVGGQLLASRAVEPRLLEREQDFRDTVLTRWQEELVGQVGAEADPTAVIGLLRLVAALAPFPAADQTVIDSVAEELQVDAPDVSRLLGELEEVGLILSRGRLRRIVPDVLADHILHRACLDRRGRPTGFAEHLIGRYGASHFEPLLRNLAELDWRIGQAPGAATVLDAVWEELTNRFAKTNAGDRVGLLQRVRPAAVFAPQRILKLVEVALGDHARPVYHPYAGSTSDADVRRELPPVLARVGQHPDCAADVLALLWQLGRDEPGPLHSNPSHPIRLAQELANHSLSRVHDEAAVALAERLIADGESDQFLWSPLDLLRGLVSRTVERTRPVGFAFQLGTEYVIASVTADLRGRAFAIIGEQGAQGSPRTQHLVADLLGDALQPPRPPGLTAPPEMVEQWKDEELRLVEMASELIRNGPTLVRMELRRELSGYTEVRSWPEVATAARAALEKPPNPEELMVTVFADPLSLAESYEDVKAKLAEYGAGLANDPRADDELAHALNAAVELLDATRALTANPWSVLHTIASENPRRGLSLARWLVDRPDVPLTRSAGAVLAPLRATLPDELEGLLDLLDTDDVRMRRMLADYLAAGSWFAGPRPSDVNRMRRLLVDDDPAARSIAVHALPRLSTVDLALASKLALLVDTSDGIHAGLVDSVLSDGLSDLDPGKFERRLDTLVDEPRLAWGSWDLLAELGKTRPQRVLDVLLGRAQSAISGMHPVYDAPHTADVLSGFDDEQYRDALRAVREQALSVAQRFGAARLFWAFDRETESSLAVLGEWLTASDLDRVRASAHILGQAELIRDVPGKDFDGGWHLLITHVNVVNSWLERASRHSAEHREVVRSALHLAMTSGMSGRAMGAADERHVLTRDTAREAAKASLPGSAQRTFWTAVVERAEREVADDALEDEEFGEQ